MNKIEFAIQHAERNLAHANNSVCSADVKSLIDAVDYLLDAVKALAKEAPNGE